jgi:hypothetical protein
LIFGDLTSVEAHKKSFGETRCPPGLSRYSKTPLELNHAAIDIPGFHEVECFFNVGVRLVCKTCKQTTKKAPGELAVPRGFFVTLNRF